MEFEAYVGTKNLSLKPRCKNTTLQDVSLPQAYLDRTFVQWGNPYDFSDLAGKVIYWDNLKQKYVFTPVSVITNLKAAEWEIIEKGEIFSKKLDCGSKINGSVAIAGIEVEEEHIMELTVKDVAKAMIPDNSLDMAQLRAVRNQLPTEELKNYFFVKHVILTEIIARDAKKSKFKASISASWISFGGEVYRSEEDFSKNTTVSVVMMSLNDLLLAR